MWQDDWKSFYRGSKNISYKLKKYIAPKNSKIAQIPKDTNTALRFANQKSTSYSLVSHSIPHLLHGLSKPSPQTPKSKCTSEQTASKGCRYKPKGFSGLAVSVSKEENIVNSVGYDTWLSDKRKSDSESQMKNKNTQQREKARTKSVWPSVLIGPT